MIRWRVTVRLSYIQDAWCLKVNFSHSILFTVHHNKTVTVKRALDFI